MRNYLILFLILFLIIACDSKQVVDQYETLPSVWGKGQKIEFKFSNPDTINRYNMFVNVRNNNDYEFSNLFLIVELQAPNTNRTIDTLEYEMTNPDGSWLGSGFSSIKENKLWYKENARFKENGEYTITIEHAMRKNGSVLGVEELKGLTEVGFRLEKNLKQE